MSKKFFTAILAAASLFSTSLATHALVIEVSHESTGFLFEKVTDLWTGAFVVDNAYDNRGVVLNTYVYRSSWTGELSFDPFLVVWDANGNMLGFQNDKSRFDENAGVYLGKVDDGIYYFTIGNWPNQLITDTVDFNDVGASFAYYGDNPSILYYFSYIPPFDSGKWYVYIDGASAFLGGVSAVPEPETWAMLLLGLAMVGSVARRRKH